MDNSSSKTRSHSTVDESADQAHANTKRRVSVAFPNRCVTVTSRTMMHLHQQSGASAAPVGAETRKVGSAVPPVAEGPQKGEQTVVGQAMAAEAKAKAPGDSPEERFVQAAKAGARVTVHPKMDAEQREVTRQTDENAPKDPHGRPL